MKRITNCITCRKVATLYVKKDGTTGDCKNWKKERYSQKPELASVPRIFVTTNP